jgi:hypothetical protein
MDTGGLSYPSSQPEGRRSRFLAYGGRGGLDVGDLLLGATPLRALHVSAVPYRAFAPWLKTSAWIVDTKRWGRARRGKGAIHDY